MANKSITDLTSKSPVGSMFVPIEDSGATGKTTINNLVSASATAQDHEARLTIAEGNIETLSSQCDSLSSGITTTNENVSDLAGRMTTAESGLSTVTAQVATLNDTTTWTMSGSTVIPNNSDLNDYTTPGNYGCYSSTQAATMSHCPISSTGFELKVYRLGTSNHIVQELIYGGFYSKRLTRHYSTASGEWSDWTLELSVLKKTVTGTTTSAGNISLGLNAEAYRIVTIYCTSARSQIVLPFVSDISWSAHVSNANLTALDTGEVTLDIYYFREYNI